MRGPRRGRLAALAASAGLATWVVMLTGAGTLSAAQTEGQCSVTTLVPGDDCPTTTSSVIDTTTTSVLQTTTTRFVSTSTTFRSSPTTQAAAPRTTTTTTVAVPTSHDVLIPGDGTEGAESTTTTTEVPTTISDDGTSDAALLALVVGGLVLLAVAVGILTWRYWVATRPPAGPAVGSDHG